MLVLFIYIFFFFLCGKNAKENNLLTLTFVNCCLPLTEFERYADDTSLRFILRFFKHFACLCCQAQNAINFKMTVT